jgi:hypothetical protein
MGLGVHITEAIIREHLYRPITGDVVLVGRQTVHMPLDNIVLLMRRLGVKLTDDAIASVEIDQATRHVTNYGATNLITDRALFGLLGTAQVKALDHSNFEGAEIIHDLTKPLPPLFHGTADFIVDGSTLDNVFDPASVITNLTKMLRPGGRLLAINALSMHVPAYVIVSPFWLLDYFVMNSFKDCQVLIVTYFPEGDLTLAVDIVELCRDPTAIFEARTYNPPHSMATLVFAEKGPDTTTDLLPIQFDYRSPEDSATYQHNLAVLTESQRPPVVVESRTAIPHLPRGLKLPAGKIG